MDLFEELLKHPDVVQRPRGGDGEAKGWCPWHPDREGGNPSLGINSKKRIVKCFVCGKGGAKALAKAWGIAEEEPPWKQEIDQTYDYHQADGSLAFQVVRIKVPPGSEKKFFQRRPDPAAASGWAWNITGVERELYHLPEIRSAGPDERIWVVEGEKDADRLRSLGLVATTNPGGAGTGNGKWLARFNKEFRNRLVVIIPDNDTPGKTHAINVAVSIHPKAREVKIVHLPDLPEKGDLSDWLDSGRTIDELHALLAQALAFEPDVLDDAEAGINPERPEWQVSRLLPDAKKLTSLMNGHGYFVNGQADAYFFDQDLRKLIYLERDDRDLRILLGERYQINRQDQLYAYLLEHLLREAHTRGKHSLVRQFSYYDQEANIVYLDMGDSRVLKISASSVERRHNGEDGVLFLPMPEQVPWEYNPAHEPRILYERVIAQVNFADDGSEFTVQQQRMLFLAWLLSMAFESMMPTKVLAMAIGPGESGKTSLFRNIGRILIGPEFEVDSLLQDQKGEEDFWINLSHSFFVTYDNVDQVIRWLPDALAQVATGIRRSKRQLHTTAQLHRTKISSMLAVTARTPTVSLRREDVAGRTLVFTMKPLDAKRAEYDIQEEITHLRSDLMSDYAGMVQKALSIPLADVEVADPGMRMADFARVATRIGKGLGPEMGAITDEVVSRIRLAQYRFATEEDALTTLLGVWLTRSAPKAADGMDLGDIPNEGRQVTTGELLLELNSIAREFDMKLRVSSPEGLGKQISNMEAALSRHFTTRRKRVKRGTLLSFETVQEPGESDE